MLVRWVPCLRWGESTGVSEGAVDAARELTGWVGVKKNAGERRLGYGRGVPVEDCIATTGAMPGKGCDGMGFEGRRDWVWGAVEEREDSNVTVDRKDFGEEVSGVDKTGKEHKTEEMLACPRLQPVERMSIDLDFFGLTEEVARPIAHSLSTNRRGGDCWGWPRLVSVSSTNTCPPPKPAAYSASATDATTTGMRW